MASFRGPRRSNIRRRTSSTRTRWPSGFRLPAVHSEAAEGAQSFAFQPAAAVAQVGAPRLRHLDYAAALVASLPAGLVNDVRDPLGAVATIYALLLDDSQSAVRAQQLQYLATQADPRANQETLRVEDQVSRVPPEAKLPLVGMVVPALRRLSPGQLAAFKNDVLFLIKADNQVSLFEYAVHRLVLKRLLPRLEQVPPAKVKYDRLSQVAPATQCASLDLGLFRHARTAGVQRAFAAGAAKFAAGGQSPGLDDLREQADLTALDAALDELSCAGLALKKSVLEACAPASAPTAVSRSRRENCCA